MNENQIGSSIKRFKGPAVLGAVRDLALIMTLVAGAASNGSAQVNQVTFQSVAGDSVTLSGDRGKVVVLVFSATWVPTIKNSLPALQRIADRYRERGMIFYWVSLNSTRVGNKRYASDAKLKAFAEENGWRLEVLRDPQMKAFRAFGLDALPSVVIIDRTGQVYRKYTGFDNSRPHGYNFILKTLNRLLE